MKKLVLSAALVAGLFVANPASAQSQLAATTKTAKVAKAATAYQIETSQSNLEWNGKKVTGEHSGNINISKGEILVNGNKIVGGNVLIDMTSISNTDLTDQSYNQKLVGHLKSEDFFSSEKHPTGNFKITSVAPIKGAKTGAANYTVNGDLTIKGITKPIAFPAVINVKNGVASATGTATLDRTKWDIRYGSKSFFPNIADKAIYDDFTVKFNLLAKKESASLRASTK
ncbi:MAG: Rhodanese-like domain protein [uncultured Adhaeribacter sp.]|uniref:Rhodanese-like domain protein n=1 Tax=uncultured Adhaeribacter sp. TaxID=448109 RepID=A0A6J4HDT5_9BACT|nr:MAG: Rhodanese-like domain protein [uncultured Adhaeribacter sp.]